MPAFLFYAILILTVDKSIIFPKQNMGGTLWEISDFFANNLLKHSIREVIVLESNWKIAVFGVKVPVIAMLGG